MTGPSVLDEVRAAATYSRAVSASNPGFVTARAALQIGRQAPPSYVFGFGAARDRLVAEKKAFYELVESVVSSARFYSSEERGELIDVFADADSRSLAQRPRASQLVGARYGNRHLTGTGLAVHFDRRAAFRHALLETFERHAVTQFWFRQKLQAVRHDYSRTDLGEEHSVGLPVRIGEEHYWGAISITRSERPALFASGSAVRPDYASALEHAKGEMAMVVDDALAGNAGVYQPAHHRVMRLRDEAFVQRCADHLAGLVSRTARSQQPDEWPHPADGSYAVFFEDQSIIGVRYLHEQLEEPRMFSGDAVPNPFL